MSMSNPLLDLLRVRASVTELIEENKALKAELRATDEAFCELMKAVKFQLDTHKRYGIGGAARDRLAVAFARVQGGDA